MKEYSDVQLSACSTFGLAARGRRMVVVEPGEEVPRLEGEVLIVGEGSDLVFAHDYEGTLLRLADADVVSCCAVGDDEVRVTAWGGMQLDRLIGWCLAHGCYGMENLSAVPGTVGAAVVQNVGAYGVEMRDVVEQVATQRLGGDAGGRYDNADCRFGYRTSRFKQGGGDEVVTEVSLRLRRRFSPVLSYKALEGLPHADAWQLREAITRLRWEKLPRPEEYGSVGSFFKNPVVDAATVERLLREHPTMPVYGGTKLSAGWLIEQAGWKGRTLGRAGVWPRQALVLYNCGGCTGTEVLALAEAIERDVESRFGIALEREAIII